MKMKNQFSNHLSKNFLNRENVLALTDNGKRILDMIFDSYVCKWQDGKNIKNPFYEDKNPSLSIKFINGTYLLNDFGNPDYKGDVFHFAGHHYKLNPNNDFFEILKRINQDLRLGLIEKKSNSFKSDLIDFKDFNNNELAFWGKYGITESILNKYKAKSVHRFSLTNNKGNIYNNDQLMFSFEVNFGCFKIYQPENKKYKFSWVGKKPENYIFGFQQMDYSKDTLIITAGEKDVMTFASLGYNAISFNSETEMPSTDTINEFKDDFQNVIICYDND